MITPLEMCKLTIVGPRRMLKRTIDALYERNAYHITDHTKGEKFDIGLPLEDAPKLSDAALRIRSAMSHLGLKASDAKESFTFSQIESKSRKVEEMISDLVKKKRGAESKVAELESKQAKLALLPQVPYPIEALFAIKSLDAHIGYVKKGSLDALTQAGAIEISTKDADDKIIIACFSKKEDAKRMNDALSQCNFTPIDIKDMSSSSGTIEQVSFKLQKEISATKKELEMVQKELGAIAKEHGKFLISAEAILTEEIKKAEVPLRFGMTKEYFLVSGYVPKKESEEVAKGLIESAQGKLHVMIEEPKHEDDVPVKLNNPPVVRSFESLLKLFSYPRYGEIDPSFLMVLTLPLFFGMMLGDIGYGIITLIAFLILKRKFSEFGAFFNILILASISSIIFGILYGEIFGLEEIGHYHLWHVLSRAHDFEALMLLSVVVGIIHVNLGFLLGFRNELKSHGFMHALSHKGSWMIIEMAIVCWYLSFKLAPYSFGWFVGAVVSTIVGIVLLYKAEGLMGIIELPSLVSHIASYARIMAVGLASVFLAILVNESAGALFDKGILYFVLFGVPLLIIGHTFNIALGVFSPFLHSVRLHYVEFFTKFYRGGGKEFTPFGKTDRQDA